MVPLKPDTLNAREIKTKQLYTGKDTIILENGLEQIFVLPKTPCVGEYEYSKVAGKTLIKAFLEPNSSTRQNNFLTYSPNSDGYELIDLVTKPDSVRYGSKIYFLKKGEGNILLWDSKKDTRVLPGKKVGE